MKQEDMQGLLDATEEAGDEGGEEGRGDMEVWGGPRAGT